MKQMEERILKEGRVLPGDILKVDSFLNHQLDVAFLTEAGKVNSTCIERPEIGCLFDLIVLMQAFLNTGDLGKITVHIHFVCRAGTDLSIH